MPELSEMIRDHVDAVAPHVTLEDVWALTLRDRAAPAAKPRRHIRVRFAVVATVLAVALVATLLMLPTGSPQSSAKPPRRRSRELVRTTSAGARRV